MRAITCADDGADVASRPALADPLPAHGVQLVIHNAGIPQRRDWSIPEATVTYDSAQEIAVNLVGPLELTRLLLPRLALEPQARIVSVASGLALAPKSSSPVYCASRAALRFFTKILACAGAPGWLDHPDSGGPSPPGRHRHDPWPRKRQDQRRDYCIPDPQRDRQGRTEIDMSAAALRRRIVRLSLALRERIMIGR